MTTEDELNSATEKILRSDAQRKLVVAGPGTGKTYLFRKLLERDPGDPKKRLALTFIRTLQEDLADHLEPLARARTLHGFAVSRLKRFPQLIPDLSQDFRVQPRLATLIKTDWSAVFGAPSPNFVKKMRSLSLEEDEESFYRARSSYYDAVDFDDIVYRLYKAWDTNRDLVASLDLLLVDEFQDFNPLEASVVLQLAENNRTVIVGDDDQALYSELRQASWDSIRELHTSNDFETFHLPFCMRCTEVIVGAVDDVVRQAHLQGLLKGRIEKPYRFYSPKKGEASARYPAIENVTCSAQRNKVNYFGQYILEQIREIPESEIEEAHNDHDVPVLVIGPGFITKQIAGYLKQEGIVVDESHGGSSSLVVEEGLQILRRDSSSNLGWRIVLEFEDQSVRDGIIQRSYKDPRSLVDYIPEKLRTKTLEAAQAIKEIEEEEPGLTEIPMVKITTFEGAKGLSAQHVFLVGLHNGTIPRNPSTIKDLEVCKFLVGLTRAKKKCWILGARNLQGKPKTPSTFLSWINRSRLHSLYVDKKHWSRKKSTQRDN